LRLWHSPLADDDKLPLQAVDQMGILRPITKWARSVTHTGRIPEYLAAAFRLATTGRPGPVFLELPIDVLFARVDEDRVEFPRDRLKDSAGPGRAALAQALKWLREAKRPAILAGGGVWFAQAAAELTRFAELTNTPVMTNVKARGSISEEHPLAFGGFDLCAELGARPTPDVLAPWRSRTIFAARLAGYSPAARLTTMENAIAAPTSHSGITHTGSLGNWWLCK